MSETAKPNEETQDETVVLASATQPPPVDDSDNVSVASVSSKASESGASARSGIPKPSGIKPPSSSRIGRPCMGQQKVAVPAPPAKNCSDDTLRRLTEEYGRHKLSDVKEENEADDMVMTSSSPTRRNRYSSIGSAASTSMDYLWDLHPRRLSEAGLSRHSDNSTILTEDTDSFIIGQRVWVGGSKPGHIAYIGETQFAPGEWAGIALDQAIGKNDGSVSGTRYFQCEPKKGIFSRLTRLTRYSLEGGESGGAGDCISSTPMPVNGNRNSSVSPTGSTSFFRSPPSFTTSNTSLASAVVDFKLGDRVIIKSSQGSKIGTLRFMGCADFAAGEWCGVELDEPRGKNDGSVGDKRYFDCRPNFGLFAPVSKVSRSPSNRKPGSCVVHPGSGIPPSGFRRANSRESILSNVSITSAASGVRRVRLGVTSLTSPQKTSPKPAPTPLPTRTALQEVLKEKQQHIEQLLKERDLERAEIARAASQADDAEQKYITLKQEYDLYREECEKKLQEHLAILEELKKDRTELVVNLEDEKRKNEDLQFRFEEAAISKSDLELSSASNAAKISELDAQLSSEKQRLEALEAESNKYFEAEETLVRIREENEALKYEIEVAATKIQSLESEGTSSKDAESSLQKEINELQDIIKQKDLSIEACKNDITKVSEQFNETTNKFTKDLEEYKKKLEDSNGEIQNRQTLIDQLKAEIIRVENVMVEKTKTYETIAANTKDFEEKSNKEISKLKIEISAKSHDIEGHQETIAKKEEEIKKLTTQLQSLSDNLQSQNVDLDQYKANLKEIEDNLRKDLEEARLTIKNKISEVEDNKKVFAVTLAQKDNELEESKKTMSAYLEDIEKLNNTLTQIKESSNKNNQELQNAFHEKLKNAEENILKLTTNLQIKTEDYTKSANEVSTVHQDLITKDENIKKLQTTIEDLKKHLEEESSAVTKFKEDLTELQLNLGDSERKLKTSEEKIIELIQQKAKLENEVQTLVGSSGDYSARFEELTKELKEKENVMQSVKNEFTAKLQEMERSKQEMELQYTNFMQKYEKDIKYRDETLSALTKEKDSLKQEFDNASLDSKTTIENMTIKINEIQNNLADRENLLKKSKDESNQKEEKLKQELENKSTDLKTTMADLQKKLADAINKGEEIKSEISKKTLELIEFESKYNKDVELLKQSQHDMKNTYEEKIKGLELELSEKHKENQKILESSHSEISAKLEDFEVQHSEYEKQKQKLIEESNKLKVEFEDELKISKEQIKILNQKLEEIVTESNKNTEGLHEKIKILEETIESKTVAITTIETASRQGEAMLRDTLGKTSSELTEKLKALQDKIQELTNQNDANGKLLCDKNKQISENEDRYKKTLKHFEQTEMSVKSNFEEQIKKLSEELTHKNNNLQILNDELSQLKDSVTVSQSSSTEKDTQITQLKSELQINHKFVEKLQEEKRQLELQKDETSNILKENEISLLTLNNEIKKLQEEKNSSSKTSYELNLTNNLYTTVMQMLKLTEKQKIDLVDTLENVAKAECNAEKYSKLCELVDRIKVGSETSEDTQKLMELQNQLESYKKHQLDMENKEKLQHAEISQLKNELKKAMQPTKSNIPKLDKPMSSVVSPTTNEQLLEEKLLAESQVAFLNSIIVDMQKKNQEQKDRIEILEMGYSPAAAEELGLLGLVNKKMPAPRMYCDICEEFDLHETEDCPQQANEDPPPRDRSPRKDLAPQRPYCEICEEFGHATEDCQDDQTF